MTSGRKVSRFGRKVSHPKFFNSLIFYIFLILKVVGKYHTFNVCFYRVFHRVYLLSSRVLGWIGRTRGGIGEGD